MDTVDYGLRFLSNRLEDIMIASLPILENINELNDDKFTTKNRPVGVGLTKGSAGNNVTIPITSDADLYGTTKRPKISDVKQGGLGDCYLEAALQSLAKAYPDYLKSRIRIIPPPAAGGITNIGLKLFRVKSKGVDLGTIIFEAVGTKTEITFPSTVIQEGNLATAIWPKVFEKGIALARGQGWFADTNFNDILQAFDDDSNILKKISKGGWSAIYFAAIGGWNTSIIVKRIDCFRYYQKFSNYS